MQEYYKPLITECLLPGFFPALNLYMKTQDGKYVLYKPADRPFLQTDVERLERSSIKYLYIRTGDASIVTQYLENHISGFLSDDTISNKSKAIILQQASIEYVSEILRSPSEATQDLGRCKKLLKNLMQFVVSTDSLLNLMKELTAGSLYILTHSVQVAVLSMLVHDKLYEIDSDEMLDVGIGGLFHDIGITFLSNDLLERPTALTDIEYNIIKLHPVMGHEFLQKTGAFGEVALTIVKHHHERWDGSGYPGRLVGNVIPRSAQVAALCDIYSALINTRPYRRASSHEEAIKILDSDIERNFNVELFEKFREIVEKDRL